LKFDDAVFLTPWEFESMNRPFRIAAILALVLLVKPLIAEEDHDPSRLTVQRIYSGHEFEPERVSARWLVGDSAYLTLEPSKEPYGGQDLVRNDPASGEKTVLVSASLLIPPGATTPLAIDDYALTPDKARLLIYTNSQRVWRTKARGDYWVLDRSSRELHKLGGDAPPASLMHAKIAPDGLRAAYVLKNNLYVEDLRDHRITKLTNSSSPDEINGTFDWVYEEELSLRDGFRWSPDSASIAYWQLNTREEPQFYLLNNTDALYPRLIPFKYPKVGQKNARCRIGVISVQGGETRWIDLPGDPTEHYVASMEWPKETDEIVVQQLNRIQDTDRVMRADPHSGKAATILTEHDDAWLDVPDEPPPWLHQGTGLLWLSERDGWRHIYRVDRTGKTVTLLTPGDFDVIRILVVDESAGWVYFIASPENPTQAFLYRVRLDGTGRERVTPPGIPGTHDYQISREGKWAIHHYSSMTKVPTTELIRLPKHERVRLLTDNSALRKKVEALKAVKTEFFRVDINGGIKLDAWCVLPPALDMRAKYPLLVYVYGEPAAQTVLDRWGGTNQLWHWMLAQDGFVVVSIDNRGTPAPRGRAWRRAVNRQIGVLAPKEQAEAVKEVLKRRPYLDPQRVGVWGWSGGGSMTLSAMFKFPDVYSTGISIAPVANQRLYDTIYQERYMGLPGENVDGYTQGSVINFAHQLKGNLLLIHGTGDDNCHYQGTEELINELIKHNKPFTMMAYPNRSHAINEGLNTTVHLRELMTRYLKDHLRPGAMAANRKAETIGAN
jgi:dipeptidyl-peptidase-4